MKKIILMMLVLVLCLSLCACAEAPSITDGEITGTNGTSGIIDSTGTTDPADPTCITNPSDPTTPESQPGVTEEFDLYQMWQNTLTGSYLTFNRNGTVTLEDGMEYHYEYDENLKLGYLRLHDFGVTVQFNIVEENGINTIEIGKAQFVMPEQFDVCHSRILAETYNESTDGAKIVTIGETFLGVNGLKITINKAEIIDSTTTIIDLHIACENTSSEDAEFLNQVKTKLMYGGAIMAVAMNREHDLLVEELLIPAGSTRDIVATVEFGDSIKELNIVFLLIGIPCGEADENGLYKYTYIDIAPFYTG